MTIVGLDFGTTNTGAAILDGQRIRLLALDPVAPNPEICRSAIYMTRTGDYFLGSGAINSYFEQNIGRPTRFRKIWIGEIIQIFAELPVFYRDVYVYEDEFSPGRLFTSIKTALRSREYFGTAFRGAWFNPSDLVAIFLMGMRMQIEQQLGRPVQEVVLGRPVHFSTDPVEDKIAESRLLDAAFKAGFQQVALELEPVAAALAYARDLSHRETILVFDFGGGTLDFTVMQIGGRAAQRVLATGGVPIAGDAFDQRLFRVTVPRHLGEGGEYLSNKVRRPIPAHIFDTLSQPPEILSLNTPQNLEMLQQIHSGSLEPEKTHALLKVVSSNYALLIFDLVERAKRRLSQDYLTRLEVNTPDFSFHEQVSRMTFERALAQDEEMIRQELRATLARAGLKAARIDRVIRTGGSSQIPLFVDLLGEMFGYEKVHAIDIFSSVTAGLAIRGQQLAAGKIELPTFSPQSVERSSEHTSGHHPASQEADQPDTLEPLTQGAQPVDLDLVFRRLHVRQQARLDPAHLPEQVLFTLSSSGLYAAALSPDFFGIDQADTQLLDHPSSLRDREATTSLADWFPQFLPVPVGIQFVLASLDEYLLFISSRYKCISIPVRDAYLAQQSGPEGILHSLPLDVGETITAFMAWQPSELAASQVCMITASGQARAFDAALLADSIARRPYFQLERRYTGLPQFLFPASPGSLVIAGSDQGRAARAAIGDLSVQPYDLLRLRGNEWLRAAVAIPPGESLRAISDQATILEFDPSDLPVGLPPGQRGVSLRGKFGLIGFVPRSAWQSGRFWAVSNRGKLYPILNLPDGLPSRSAPVRLLRLAAHETLVGMIKIS
ncbi:MAG: Hsp70 family protein [Anaerolineales bacterium]|nr:Hsp70 family protein [Anaerolineales bacterium]